MGLETVTYIDDLNTSNPVPGDARSQGDDHIRNLKTALKNTLPNGTRPWYFPRATAKTADFGVGVTEIEKIFPCDCTADHIDVTLPTLTASNDAWVCRFVKTDASANLVRIAGTINGDADGFNLTKQWQSCWVLWTGTAWIAMHQMRIVDQVPTLDTLSILDTLAIAGVASFNATSYMFPPRGTTAQRPGADLPGAFRHNTTLDVPEFQDANDLWRQLAIASPVVGSFKNLVVTNNAGAPNTQIDIDADWVVVETASGVAYKLSALDLTVNCAGTGANGLDAGGLANNTWYYRYVIYNPATNAKAGLVSTSSSAPTLPAGYTAYARLPGAHRTGGSATFLGITTKAYRSQYVVGLAQTTNLQIAAGGGAAGSLTIPTWVAVALGNYVPPTARSVHGTLLNAQNGTGVMLAPNNSYGAQASITNPPPIAFTNLSGEILNMAFSFLLESTSIYWATDAGNARLVILGWED